MIAGQHYAVKLVDVAPVLRRNAARQRGRRGNPAAPNFAWRDFQRAVKARAKTLKPEKS
jgi:hypothetical protein